MKNWIPYAALGAACLFAGWLGGRLRSDSAEWPEFVVSAQPEETPALLRRAHHLWQVSPDRVDGRQVARFLVHLANTLDDASWWALSGPVAHAWNQLRQDSLQGPAAEANEILVPRFLRAGSVDELSSLIGRVNANGFDSNQIARLLDRGAAEPLPASGLRGSGPERLIAASIRAGDLPRAKQYLSRLAWPPDAAADARASADSLKSAVEIGLEAAAGKMDIHRAIRTWRQSADDPIGRSCLQPAIENSLLSALTHSDRPMTLPRLDDLFRQSSADEGAQPFWDRILFRLRPALVRSGELAAVDADELIRAFSQAYRKPEIAHAFWMGAGDTSWRWTPDDPRRAARFYRRALAAATSDRGRADAVKRFAFQCQRAGDPEPGLLAVREAADAIKDAAVRTELAPLTEELMQSALKTNSAAATRKQSERERQNKVLAQMRELLLKAKKENRPEDEIQALQAVIRDVEAQIQE